MNKVNFTLLCFPCKQLNTLEQPAGFTIVDQADTHMLYMYITEDP